MCLLFFDYKSDKNFPILLAANREENCNRPTTKPIIKIHNHFCYVLAGEDRGSDGMANKVGSWLGVNLYGMVVAVTNRIDGKLHNQEKLKSRGLLCHELLRMSVPLYAKNFCAIELQAGGYGGSNFLILDGHEGWVIHAPSSENVIINKIEPGFHVLTNTDMDDTSDTRINLIREQYKEGDFLTTAKELCNKENIIINDSEWGTVSSSILMIGKIDTKFHHSSNPREDPNYTDFSRMTKMISAQ